MISFLAVLGPLLAGSASLVPGRTVARVELFPPADAEFVLQATIPIPRGTFPRADGFSPFAIRDVDGTLVPTQTELVSRYAVDSEGADVVEIAARVARPPTLPLGGVMNYDVVFSPHAPSPIAIHPAVTEFLNTDRALLFKARDVYGNIYMLDPLRENLPSKVLRNGSAVKEFRTHGTMMPIAPHGAPNATLPHFVGIHSYVRVFDSVPVIELDLRIHNGHSGLSQTVSYDDPLGTVYFDGLELDLPHGWWVRDADPDSFTDGPETNGDHERYWIIKPLPNGKLHVMHRQAQTLRRLVIYRPADVRQAVGYVRDQNLAFARDGRNAEGEQLFSWWNRDTARYFPQNRRIPDLQHVPLSELRAEQQARADHLSWALRTGIAPGYPLLGGALGWCNPYGVAHGGMAGGDGIVMYHGLRALAAGTNAGWRALAMEHRMYTDRQPVALYNNDGEPTDYLQWTVVDWSGQWLPVWCFLTPLLWAADPFGFTTAPTFQVDEVIAQNLQPPYEALLASYQPIDFEHFVRYTAPAKALAWIGNDSLAKDSLMMSAALFRLSYNEFPNSQWGYYISTGMGADEHYVAAYPGIGFTFGRLESWGLDSVIAAFAMADPEWRNRVRPWFRRVVDLVDRGQSQCSGFIQSYVYEQLFQGQYRARQSIEQAITENMLVGLRETVMRDNDALRTAKINSVLTKSFNAMVTAPGWNAAANAPWTKLAVGDADYTHVPFCGATPANGFADGGDSYQCWSSFAYAYDITRDPIYLQRAAQMAASSGSLLATLRAAGLDNLENRAALLALMQELP
ncbi:MAG: hypothetical protein JNL28_02730 [Planctomycetes bacterium]|nr:hypothetical protein [Planctomycetota bacterium]